MSEQQQPLTPEDVMRAWSERPEGMESFALRPVEALDAVFADDVGLEGEPLGEEYLGDEPPPNFVPEGHAGPLAADYDGESLARAAHELLETQRTVYVDLRQSPRALDDYDLPEAAHGG